MNHMNPQGENNFSLDEEAMNIMQEISANECCLFVYFDQQKEGIANKQTKSYLLVYINDDETKIESLIHEFAIENNFLQLQDRIAWYLSGEYEIDKDWQIKDIKKTLRKDNINGLEVFSQVRQQGGHVNECAMDVCIQTGFNDGDIEVPFKLPTTNNYIVYIPINTSDNMVSIKQKIRTEVKRVFGVNVNTQNILIYFKTGNKQKIAERKELVKFIPSSASTEQFIIKFKDNLMLKDPPRQNNSVIIIKGEGIDSTKLYYDDIKNKKVSDVLSSLQPNPKWIQYGVKVCDVALKPFETFTKLENYCKISTQVTKHFAAFIIKEKQVFQAELENMKKKGQVDFQKLVIPNEDNRKHKDDCQVRAKDRAKKTNHAWFKNNLNNVKPILLYTSQLRVNGSEGTSLSIYRTLNSFLRNQSFCSVEEKDYQKWQYRFASELMHQLSKIPKIKPQVVWRGVSYKPKHYVGQEVLFKQFNSSSTNQKVAKKFANKALYRITNPQSVHQIKQYSFYQSEDQVLFEPYVTLIIDSISQVNNEVNSTNITLFSARQIYTKQLSNEKLFILWVDDKTQQGKALWQNLKQIQKTTVMIQLLSTQELNKWLQKNIDIVDDQTVELVMITNMKRIEKGLTKQKAGVDAIDTFKKYRPNAYIFVYIQWIAGAVEKLKQRNYYQSDRLKIDNNQHRLKDFLKKIGIK